MVKSRTQWKTGKKYLENSEMCEWEISWTDRAKTEVLHRVKGEKILHTIKRWRTNCVGHMVRRNCRSKHVIEGNRRDEKTKTKM
jgi:hypothetical protein